MVERVESGPAVIAAKNNFTELELSDHLRSPIGSRRDLSLFQVNFYGFLQEFILASWTAERRAGSNQDCFLAFTMAMRRSLIASEDFAGRRLNANASCNA
jgi:hypothetical protein